MTTKIMEIKITSKAYSKLRYFISECPTEVSGLGKIREVREEVLVSDGKNNFGGSHFGFEAEPVYDTQSHLEIYDVEVLPQEVSGAHSTIEEKDLAKFLFNKMKKKESVVDYKVWWHSHVNMQAYFSTTDTGTIDGSTEFPYLVSLVGNKQGEFSVRYDQWKPCRLTIEDIELKVEELIDEELQKECKQELKKKVSVKKIVFSQQSNKAIVPFQSYPPYPFSEQDEDRGWTPEDERELRRANGFLW